MPIDGQLKLLLPKYQDIDPSRHSFDAQFNRVSKRTRWENFRALCLRVLTLGLRSLNPELDLATHQLIASTEELLLKPDQAKPDEAKEVLHILTLHADIIDQNGGGAKDHLLALISKVKAFKPIAKIIQQPVAVHPQVLQPPLLTPTQRLLDLLDACRKGNFAQLNELPDMQKITPEMWKEVEGILWTHNSWTYEEIKSIPQSLLKTAALKPLPESHLKTLAGLAGHYFTRGKLIETIDDPALWLLFERGESHFQAQLIATVIDAHCGGSSTASKHFERLCSASFEAWQTAGETLSHSPSNLAHLMAPFVQTQKPEALMAYVNGIAASSKQDWTKSHSITAILAHFIDPLPLSQLSSQALAFFNVQTPIPGSKKGLIPKEDYIWYRLLKSFTLPQQEQQKRLLNHLVQKILKADPCLLSQGRDCFLALTPAHLQEIPWQHYPRCQQLFLALRSQHWQQHAPALQNLVRTLTNDEQKRIQELSQPLNIGHAEKLSLISTLWEPSHSSPLIEKWILETLPAAKAAELLLLPKRLLLKHLDKVCDHQTRLQLLRLCDPETTRHALDIWWNSFIASHARLLRKEFPFAENSLLREPAEQNEHQAKVSLQDELWKISEILSLHSDDASRSRLQLLPRLASQFSSEAALLANKNEDIVWKLFATGDTDFQAKVIASVIEAFLQGNGAMASRLAKLNRASTLSWQKAGESVRYYQSLNSQESAPIATLTAELKSEAIFAFINGLSIQSGNSSSTLITHLLAILIVDTKSFTRLTDRALERFRLYEIVFPSKTALWQSVLPALDPQQPQEKRLLIFLTKQILIFSSIEVQVSCFKALRPDQLDALSWDEYPRFLQLFFAWKSHGAHSVQNLVKSLSQPEQTQFHAFCDKAGLNRHHLLSLIQMMWQPGEEIQAPLVQALIHRIFRYAQAGDLLQFPRDLLLRNLNKVHDPYIRVQLIKSLDPADIRQAAQVWWHDYFWGIWSFNTYEFPIERMIAALEDPALLTAIAYACAGYFTARELIPSHLPKSWILRELLNGLEKSPWKIWKVLDHLEINALRQWKDGSENPRTTWPECFKAIDWYNGKADEMHQKMQSLTNLVTRSQWKEAYDLVQTFDANTRNYFLASFRLRDDLQPSQIKDLSKPLFVAALFDDKSRRNIKKILQSGRSDGSLAKWVDLIETLQQSVPKIANFSDKVRLAINIGGRTCPLRDQYRNPNLADVTLFIDKVPFPSHRALLSLDPFFQPFLSKDRNEIPADQCKEAELHLKWLYNTLTLREIAQPETQRLLQHAKRLKLTLAPLFDQASSDILVKGMPDPQGIHAHRFILASALPFFEALFRAGMRDSATPTVVCKGIPAHQIQAVLSYIYTGIEPQCPVPRLAFRKALKFLKAGSASI